MSMTRKEAAKIIRRADDYIIVKENDGDKDFVMSSSLKEAVDLAVSALRTPTREQVERMRGEWIGDDDKKVGTIDGSPIKSATCSACGNWLVGSDEYDCSGYFCPACGSPMTDESVDIMLERMEALYEYNA